MYLILAILALAFGAYILWRLVSFYRSAPGTVWQRLLATAEGSATILVHQILLAGSMLDAGLVNAATVLNLPEVTDFVQKYMPPQWVGWTMAAIAVVTIVARLRTL